MVKDQSDIQEQPEDIYARYTNNEDEEEEEEEEEEDEEPY
jgi:hypothetical protein